MAVHLERPGAGVAARHRRGRESLTLLGPYAALLPTLLIIGLFTLYPVAYAAYLSVHHYILSQPFAHPFVGLQNFQEVITGSYVQASLVATAIYTVLAVPMILVLGLLAALLLNTSLCIAAVLRVIIVLPWAIPAVIAGIMWQWLFSDNYGVINGLLYATGLIHHYERGVQYLAIRYTERLADAGAVRSVGSRGDPYDSALAEAVNGLYKAEVIRKRGPWRSLEQVELATAEWVDWWNHRRLHSAIDDMPPAEYEALYYQQRAAAAAA